MTTVLFEYEDPAVQAWMVLDRVRTSSYARAIQQVVRDGDVVLDIGSGSGILALLAAKAGARKVYAVERGAMASLVEQHARENGVADRVEVLRTDLMTLQALPEEPTVIQGEMLGHFAAEEHQHRLYARARSLAPRARLIPSSYRVVLGAVAAGGIAAEYEALDDVFGVRLGTLRSRLASRVSRLRVKADDLLGPEVDGPEHLADAPLPTVFEARLPITRDGRLNGVVASFAAELAPGVTLRSGVSDPNTHWEQTFFPVEPPLEVKAGNEVEVMLRARLITDKGTWAWTVRCGEEIRRGDAMQALVGGKEDLIKQLSIRRGPPVEEVLTERARAWGRFLIEEAVSDVDELARRLWESRAEGPAQPPPTDEADARQIVLGVLRTLQAVEAK